MKKVFGVNLLLLLIKGKVKRLAVGTCTVARYVYSHTLRQKDYFHDTALEVLACLINVIAEALFSWRYF